MAYNKVRIWLYFFSHECFFSPTLTVQTGMFVSPTGWSWHLCYRLLERMCEFVAILSISFLLSILCTTLFCHISFVLEFEVNAWKTFGSVLSRDYFSYLWFLGIGMNFRMAFPFLKEASGFWEVILALQITWASTDILAVVPQPWLWDALTRGCFLMFPVFRCPGLSSVLSILDFWCCVKCDCLSDCLFLQCRSLVDYLCTFYVLKHWWIHWVVLVFLVFNKWDFTPFKVLLSENTRGFARPRPPPPRPFDFGCPFSLYLCNCSGYHPTLRWEWRLASLPPSDLRRPSSL